MKTTLDPRPRSWIGKASRCAGSSRVSWRGCLWEASGCAGSSRVSWWRRISRLAERLGYLARIFWQTILFVFRWMYTLRPRDSLVFLLQHILKMSCEDREKLSKCYEPKLRFYTIWLDQKWRGPKVSLWASRSARLGLRSGVLGPGDADHYCTEDGPTRCDPAVTDDEPAERPKRLWPRTSACSTQSETWNECERNEKKWT